MLAEVSSNNGPGRCTLQWRANARKVLQSCCSNVYRIAINFLPIIVGFIWWQSLCGPDCPVTIPLNSTAVDNSSQQQWAATAVAESRSRLMWGEQSAEWGVRGTWRCQPGELAHHRGIFSTMCLAESNFWAWEYSDGVCSSVEISKQNLWVYLSLVTTSGWNVHTYVSSVGQLSKNHKNNAMLWPQINGNNCSR